MRFANKVVIITGASTGIGRSLAREFARTKARVGLLARRLDLLQEAAREARDLGATAAVAPADIGDRQQTVAAIRRLGEQLGPIDLLVANAGLGLPTYVEQTNIDEVEAMVRVNLLGVVYSIEAVLPEMLKRKQGHISAVSSLAAYKGLPGESGYCCSKAAVNSYLEGLRIQLRDYGIAVTTICPGFITTPMTAQHQFKMPWLLTADQAAQRIVQALWRRKKVFNFPWQTSWLMKLTRWLPDWLMLRNMRKYIKSGPVEQDREPPKAHLPLGG